MNVHTPIVPPPIDDGPLIGRRPGRPWLDISRLSLRGWVVLGLADFVLVVICYQWVDRPVARLAHLTLKYNPLWRPLIRLPDLITLSAYALLIVLPFLAWQAGGFRRLARMDYLGGGLLAGVAFVISAVIKTFLKWGFGRSWPETWVGHNPSYIRDGLYGFFPFHGGDGYASFPSGHMTAAMSIVVVGWQLWPRYAAFWLCAAAGAGLGLVGMNFHFVSDVLAGAYLGSACATAVLWKAAEGYRKSDHD
jgi:membrane-associated phospholipid phosphatase